MGENVRPQTRTPVKRREEPEERALVIDVAGRLLDSSGLNALTFDTLAARADVPEELICRWWPSEEALALDVLCREWIARAAHVRRAAFKCGL